MNADHAEAVRLYATKLLGAPEAAWRLTGIDPEGLDLAAATGRCGSVFQHPVTTAQELRKMVVELAARARGA